MKKILKNICVTVESRQHSDMWLTIDKFDNKHISDKLFAYIQTDTGEWMTDVFEIEEGYEYLKNKRFYCDIEIEINNDDCESICYFNHRQFLNNENEK